MAQVIGSKTWMSN